MMVNERDVHLIGNCYNFDLCKLKNRIEFKVTALNDFTKESSMY